MSSTLVLKVANVTSTITFAKSDVEVAQVLRWFIQDWASPPADGLTQAQLNQYYLDQATARITEMVQREAKRTRLRMLQAGQISVEDQATADVAIS